MAATIAPFPPSSNPNKTFAPPEVTKPGASFASSESARDVQGRSQKFGVYLAQTIPLTNNIASAFVAPLSFSDSTRVSAAVTDTLSEVLHPRPLQDGSPGKIRKDQHEQLLHGFGSALAWIFQAGEWESSTWIRQLALQAMLPVYLVRQDESWDKGFWHSLTMLQRLATLVQWSQLLDEHGAKEWLTQETQRPANPCESMERAFHLSLATVSDSYWSFVSKRISPPVSKQPQPLDTHNEQALWQLATQLSNRTTKLTIPSQIRIGVISWERVLQHWDRLSQSLLSSDEQTSIAGPVVGQYNEPTATSPVPSKANATTQEKRVIAPPTDHRLVEIRSSNDPQLSSNLDRLLDQCRRDQSILSLVVIKRLQNSEADTVSSESMAHWQSRFIDAMMRESQASDLRGFTTEAGELALIYQDADRSDLSNWIRLSFSNMASIDENRPVALGELEPLVAGVAMVSEPTRAFRIEQLIDGAWRCLDGASIQGAHAVKTIQVY